MEEGAENARLVDCSAQLARDGIAATPHGPLCLGIRAGRGATPA